MAENSFYTKQELNEIGFRSLGRNVLLSRKASFYAPELVDIGSNVRIDDFCVLSGRICLGNFIHIAVYSALFGGKAGIVMQDFSTLSSGCAVYAKSDDYSGSAMTNPMVPEAFCNVMEQQTVIGKHVIVGSGSRILPGASIGEGTAVGSMSLVNKALEAWGIYAGIPCRKIGGRKKDLLQKEKEFIGSGRTAGGKRDDYCKN